MKCACAVLLLLLAEVSATAAQLVVPATADIYLAGQPGGVSVSDIAFGTSDSAPGQAAFEVTGVLLTPGAQLEFSASGGASNDPGGSWGPGGQSGTLTSYDPATGVGALNGVPSSQVQPVPFALSGHSNIPLVALVGVFTGDYVPLWGTVSTLPPSLDFGPSALGTEFEALSPQLRQAFYIGDGVSSTCSPQRFTVPLGATHLYLGINDGPGTYCNNSGTFAVEVHAISESMVTNVQAHQQQNESRKVEITYNLTDPDSTSVYVTVQISTDGGCTYSITPTSVTGDTGWVRPGGRRMIVWDAKAEYPTAVWSSCRARIRADDSSGGVYPGQMVYIPAGSFLMGNNGSVPYSFSNELPQHSVYLSGYWIGEYEVTRGEYRQFINSGGYSHQAYWSTDGWNWKVSNGRTEPYCWPALTCFYHGPTGCNKTTCSYAFTQTESHPVVGVSYYEAEAFCNWAGGHLPTEPQWEKAARWDGHPRTWPWGDTWDAQKCNGLDDTLYPGYQTAPVGSYPSGASPHGCHDMAGNLEEWCKDWYVSYPGCSSPFDYTGSYRVLRGGVWGGGDGTSGGTRCAYRIYGYPYYDLADIGFRVAR